MSNLIIGFIGIALFTGCILYGTTYLGTSFEAGQDSGTAAYLLTQMTAVAGAVAQYEAANGVSEGATVGNIANYTSTPVLNPTSTSVGAELANSAGYPFSAMSGASLATFTPAYVVVDLGSNVSICSAFASQSESIAKGATVSSAYQTFASGANHHDGCFRANYTSGSITDGDYVAYSMID